MPRARSHEDPPNVGEAHQPSTTSALSIGDVVRLTGLSRAYVYALIGRGEFPSPAKVGRRSIWSRMEVLAWLDCRFAERPHPADRANCLRRGR